MCEFQFLSNKEIDMEQQQMPTNWLVKFLEQQDQKYMMFQDKLDKFMDEVRGRLDAQDKKIDAFIAEMRRDYPVLAQGGVRAEGRGAVL